MGSVVCWEVVVFPTIAGENVFDVAQEEICVPIRGDVLKFYLGLSSIVAKYSFCRVLFSIL